jgi:hypothetical protein
MATDANTIYNNRSTVILLDTEVDDINQRGVILDQVSTTHFE